MQLTQAKGRVLNLQHQFFFSKREAWAKGFFFGFLKNPITCFDECSLFAVDACGCEAQSDTSSPSIPPLSSQLKAPQKSKGALGKLYKSYLSSCIILLKELQDKCQEK